ncbi:MULTISPECIES: PD40 domain-containing protein [unclassified Arenibacter]|uniref:TolB family protein n=1 Tax=unclassified Arenibacter TaxID=2615047 RepID=UPI000E3458CB|nr:MULTISPECIES: PD40 domain-containing protein [unclassified Arenibacter]MCM4163074.1 cell envelope biogenesis protein OmpA [Arenibacter sp. A80]RFT57108.1 cell envelope biogenesis protein OmpA [Arenibacter sp. P308M17]
MNLSNTLKGILGCIITLFFCSISAQESKMAGLSKSDGYENSKRAHKYHELLRLGFKENEIFEDLGNAHFLAGNYGEAIFWYKKLMDTNIGSTPKASYYERYLFALDKMGSTVVETTAKDKDWLAQIKGDYQVNTGPEENNTHPEKVGKYKDFNFQQPQEPVVSRELTLEDLGLENEGISDLGNKEKYKFAYNAPIAITEDGRTAYFSKAVYTKPLVGLLSKKELVHRIFKAIKINGEWQDIKEVTLVPKHYSAIHPTVSPDGKRLFFASNMPGTFGKYDIYVADIDNDGSFSVAKNLGLKVNTDDNDLYPKIIGGSSLVFASEGRKGFGGLDVFMVQVDQRKVGTSVNLGTDINSTEDEFSILLTGNNGMGYVMSNRGERESNPQRVAFTYSKEKRDILLEKKKFNILESMDDKAQINFSNTVFEE